MGKPMRWLPVRGNCNDAYQTNDTPVEFVRCTGVEKHAGLHRCHFTPPDVADAKKHLMMWGDTSEAVSIDALRNVPNPLGLIQPVTEWWCPTEQRWTWCHEPCPDGQPHGKTRERRC